jgi:phosphoribosyl-AMP cyclohydrolase / phosphoribosyl-ATP pyrophosphohydrolase
MKENLDIDKLKFDEQGLIPAIVQDYKTKDVLMVAYMNNESLRRTLEDGKTCFWSRSRKQFWVKGETSGHFQFVKSVAYDCDMDALLIKVRQVGVACHTGNPSCFYREMEGLNKE